MTRPTLFCDAKKSKVVMVACAEATTADVVGSSLVTCHLTLLVT